MPTLPFPLLSQCRMWIHRVVYVLCLLVVFASSSNLHSEMTGAWRVTRASHLILSDAVKLFVKLRSNLVSICLILQIYMYARGLAEKLLLTSR